MSIAITALLLVTVAALFLYGVKADREGTFFMSKDFTTTMKGLAAIVVVFVHFPTEYQNKLQDLVDADLLGEDVDGELAVQDLQRFIKIQMTPVAVAETPGGTFFGAGLGHFKGGTRVEKTEFYKQNEWLITGTVNMFMFLYMQLGLLGFVWFTFYLIFLLNFRKKEIPYAAQLKLYLMAVAIMSIFYNE